MLNSFYTMEVRRCHRSLKRKFKTRAGRKYELPIIKKCTNKKSKPDKSDSNFWSHGPL